MSEAVSIDKRFVVNLKGKDYVTWPGTLDAATKAGLKSLTVKAVQLPSKENGGVAIVMATAVFEDGRVFEDYGDAGPETCSPMIAKAALRMASTRAKGRVLRDAVNCGMTLVEELPDDERQPARGARPPASAPRAEAPPAAEPEWDEEPTPVPCEWQECGAVLSPDEIQGCVKHAERLGGKWYCAAHGKAAIAARKAGG